jgi:phospholipid/cholesterol/gamma-HCH transport system permease protein
VFSRNIYIAFISGALFFVLVGGMLGATTIAVVKVLTDNALGGFLKYVLTPKVILKIINGSYIVYLVPAIGAVLFVARSGSIITSWLGVLVLGRQTKALKSLGVSPDRYLRAPVILSLWLAYLGAALVFGIGMWFGSVTTAEYLFDVADAADLLRFPQALIWESRLHYKIALYSVFLTFFITGFGLAPKISTETVAMHTTKAIIYTTVAISITELLFALDVLLI